MTTTTMTDQTAADYEALADTIGSYEMRVWDACSRSVAEGRALLAEYTERATMYLDWSTKREQQITKIAFRNDAERAANAEQRAALRAVWSAASSAKSTIIPDLEAMVAYVEKFGRFPEAD
jgi:hypothetical protein